MYGNTRIDASEAITTRTAQRYWIAVVTVASALGITLLLQRIFPYPFLFLFFGAVMVSAWFGGSAVGFSAVLLSTLAVDYFFVPPFRSFAINVTAEAYFASFVFCTLIASWVSSAKKKSESELREARDQLEIRVAERTGELHRSNLEFQESERRLRLLTEVIPQQIWSGTPDGSIDYCNQQLLEYTGRTLDEMRGELFLDAIDPSDRERFHLAWLQALATETAFEGEWRVRGRDGKFRWFFTRCVPLRSSDGQTVRWYGTNTDIEDHHNAKATLLRTQAELARLSRSLSLGELTASIAHELRQPLAAAVTHGEACLEWLSANPPNLEKARHSVQRFIEDGRRAGDVLARIRALFQKEAPAKIQFDIDELIFELVAFFRDEAGRRGISIVVQEKDCNLPKVEADRIQVQQVLLNLVLNAMESLSETPEGRKEIVIRSSQQDASVLVSVEDTGRGLAQQATSEIFKPFFTTKPHGIGMGLAISRSIVEAHEGRLWAAAMPSGGAVFFFTLPIRSGSLDA
jgi:PAS domain S-box-containing protein